MPDDPVPVTAEMLKRAQDGEKDPVSPAVPFGPLAKTIEDLAIAKDDPYPTGSPPVAEEGKPMGVNLT